MATLTVSSDETGINQIISSFRSGITSADECFCLVLSLDGYEATRFTFLSAIDSLKLTHPSKYMELFNIYKTYFSQCPADNFTDPIECSVENGLLTSDFGYELDMEVALTRSMTNSLSLVPEEGCTDSCSPHLSSYASFFKKPLCSQSYSQNKGTPDEQYSVNKDTNQIVKPDHSELRSAEQNSVIPGLVSHDNHIANKGKRKKKGKKANIQPYSGMPAAISNKPVVYWIRRDLRIYDNPALVAAAEANAPVIMVFLWSEQEEDPSNDVAAGGATKLWLHHALKALNAFLVENYGNGIIFRKTTSCKSELKSIFNETGAKTLVMNDVYEPFLKRRDDNICNNLEMNGVTCKRFHSYLLYEPGSVSAVSLGMKGVGSVGHFMECCRRSATQSIGQPVDSPGLLPKSSKIPTSMELDELELAKMPRRKDGSIVSESQL